MKLIVEIEAEEKDIRDAVNGIPAYFLASHRTGSPVQLLARALKTAYETHGGRAALLTEIERRMRSNGIFYQDIWERTLKTDTVVLREIVDGNFEQKVLAMRKPSA